MRYKVHFAIDVPILFAVTVEASSREEAERLARDNPWESSKSGPILATDWEKPTEQLEHDWESDRPLELIPERGQGGIEDLTDGA